MAITSRGSEISKTEYDVFLSFRGPDTRQGFTDVLYNHLIDAGINVFRDDNELEIGDTIESILDAIRNSKICVPIFSKSFASSAWCLREVAKMVELNKEIVPIFYDVTPDDVKLKTPLYADQMDKEQLQGKGKAQAQLEEWKEALMQVGRIKGRELNETGFFEFSKKFRAEVLLKLRVQQKYTIKHFVEMPDQVEEALKLLQMQSVDVRFLGMYGMGGVGKTTLSRIIFNQISSNFDSCCFLANIREERSSKGVEYLRTKLLQDLNPKEVSNNKNFRMKSILIVLDDVGERSHIEELVGDSISFGPRSRIIVTTRDESALLMNVAEASSSAQGGAKVSTTCITKMKVKGMNEEQAMQLFSRHAFGKDYPPEDYKKLCKDVILICGGLPLALEVIGSLLYDKSVEVWEDKVTNLKKIPAEDVQKKLMISYNALEDFVKEIFLDIACFFIGEGKSYPIYMWDACGFGPNWGVEVLIAMSLVQITEDGTFWMHDQLRDLGREIVRIKGYNSSTSKEGSRIQTYEDAFSIQKRNKEKEVVGLHLRGSDNRLTDFAKFESLRFLRVAGDETFHHRKFWQLSTNLTWLSLKLNNRRMTAAFKHLFNKVFQNQDNSYLAKLAVLDLSESTITDNWEGWILIQELRRLKVLDLTRCKKLTRTPNFSKMEALEKLILGGCCKLAKIDSSIGMLRKLKHLNLENCYKLEELPEEVGSLEDVEQIIMACTNVSKLPDSIGKLKNLEHLDLSYSTELEKLPESIGHLRSLVHLEITWARKLREIPTTIGLLVKLKHLTLSGCYHYLYKLPDSIGDLTSLVSLDISDCHMIEELPSSVTRLEKLERLSLYGCERLLKLPDDLGKLELLVELDLPVLGVSPPLPKMVAQLSFLKKLDLSGCYFFERVPELPTSLTDLRLTVWSLIQVTDLSKLSLRKLSLIVAEDICSGVEEPFFKSNAMLARLEVLELLFASQTSLPVEFFSALTQLKSLTINSSSLKCTPPFPSSLQSLTLLLLGEAKFPCLSNLSNNLSQLKIVCDSVEGLPDLSTLKSLEVLAVSDCEQLVEIPGLGSLVSLTTLAIEGCNSLKSLENIKNLTNLRCVGIRDCENFKGIQGLEELEVPGVKISGCKCKDISRMTNRGQELLESLFAGMKIENLMGKMQEESMTKKSYSMPYHVASKDHPIIL